MINDKGEKLTTVSRSICHVMQRSNDLALGMVSSPSCYFAPPHYNNNISASNALGKNKHSAFASNDLRFVHTGCGALPCIAFRCDV